MRSRGLPACTNCGRSPASALHLKADRLQSPVAAIIVSGALNGWNWAGCRLSAFRRWKRESCHFEINRAERRQTPNCGRWTAGVATNLANARYEVVVIWRPLMNKIQAVARFKIKPGKTDEFKRLSEKCMELAREKDPGTIRYDIFLNDEETEAVVYEEYESPEAHLKHFENMGENAAAIFEIVDMEGELWGNPSPDLRAGVEEHGVKVYTPFMRLTE